MKQKTLTLIIASIFIIGIVTAGTINVSELEINPSSFIAGSTTNATFSFDYSDDYDGLINSSLVLRINLTSLDPDPKYSVWRNDFSLVGMIKQYSLFWPFKYEKVFSLYCADEEQINFYTQRGLLYTQENSENGTFYCYNKNNYLNTLELDKKDKVTLQISSHQALYPGTYSVSVELMEMEPDNYPPIIKLNLEKTLFNENDIIPIRLNVSDMYNIDYVEYEIINPELSENFYASGWISANFNSNSGLYEDDFVINEHSDLNTSGTYWIKARACDVLGNRGDL